MPDPRPSDRIRDPSAAGEATRAFDVDSADGHADADSGPEEVTRLAASGSSRARHIAHERPTIEDYEIYEEIHRGGQGVVYRALQIGTKREVALKVLLEGPFAGEDTRRRFEREIELAASLKHPHIVTILDSGISHGRHYFAMEFIKGARLDHYVDKHRPPLSETLELFEKTCNAVNFAHQRGVIHRDLKPTNILVDAEANPHVLDFGLAKPTRRPDEHEAVSKTLSTTGQVLGTVAYMSPEQAKSPQDVDVRSDVYSLGVMFYEVLLGRPPYPVSGSLAGVLRNIAEADPASPRSVRMDSRFGRQIDDELTTILLKTLEKDPDRRYQTAADLGHDLRRYLNGEAIEAKRASGLYVFKKALRRYRIHVTVASAMLLMLFTFLFFLAYLYSNESRLRAEAVELRQFADDKTHKAEQAREDAQAAGEATRQALEKLRGALVRQNIQSGDLARARGDLAEARDGYWQAYDTSVQKASLWNLRHYYMETGELSSFQLYFGAPGPTTVSPDGSHAAVCALPGTVSVVDIHAGRTVLWYPVPSEALCVALDEERRVAAAGVGWARLYAPEAFRARAAVDLPDNFEPQSVHIADEGRTLLVVGSSRVLVYRIGGGGSVATVNLLGARTGEAEFSTLSGYLAVPTQAGVQLISVEADGSLRTQLIWQTLSEPPRDVGFSGDDLLAVLADRVYMIRLGGENHGDTVPFFNPPDEWDMVDLGHGVGMLVLASRDGHLALYRSGALERSWRVTHGSLEDVYFDADERTLVTLDGRGTLTRWAVEKAADRRRRVLSRTVADWAVSADGSSIAMMDVDGRVVVYDPSRSPRPRSVPGSSLLFRIAGLGAMDASLAIDAAGERLLFRRGGSVSFTDLRRPRGRWTTTWRDEQTPVLRQAVLSPNGRWVAFHAESAAGDRQRVSLFATNARNADRGGARRRGLEPIGRPVEFMGSAVRSIAFLPTVEVLLIARSNGALELVKPGTETPESWVRLDSAPLRIALDRSGARLAAACDDGAVRILSVAEPTNIRRVQVGGAVAALDFNAAGDVLLVRTDDGVVRLLDVDTGEEFLRWNVSSEGQRPLAAWIGSDDALLLAADGGVSETNYAAMDGIIAGNRGYAAQRAVTREVERGEFAAAWAATERLYQADAAAGRDARVRLLELVLRRPAADVPDAWVSAVLGEADARTNLRLAHAAYVGGRFDLARRCFEGAAGGGDGEPDAYTLWRWARCDYLADDYPAAASRLAELINRDDLGAGDLATVQLELTAALFFDGRSSEARRVGLRIGTHPRERGRRDAAAVTTARSIAGYILGVAGEAPMLATFSKLLSAFAEDSLPYRDDPHFFFGELARKRGDEPAARLEYQRCIDAARDNWPSDWARYRLRHMAASGGLQ